MAAPTNREVIAQWRDEPAPLLSLLHAFHDRDGVYLGGNSSRHRRRTSDPTC